MPGSVGQSVHLFMTSKACLMAFSHLKRKSRANVDQGAFPQTWEGWEWRELCNIFQPWTFRILQQLFWLAKAKKLSIITVIPILPMSAGMQHHNQHLLSPHHQSRTSYGSLKSDVWCKNERRGTMISQWCTRLSADNTLTALWIQRALRNHCTSSLWSLLTCLVWEGG